MIEFVDLEQITRERIEALVADGYGERRTIEYKRDLPDNSDGAKKEFLADISSFANAAGGFLFYGIPDKKDSSGQNTGTPESAAGVPIANVSAEMTRLENIWRSAIEPRIEGIRIKAVEGFSNGPVVVIQIPKSWSHPHIVTFKGSTKFFTRGGSGKYPMDLLEIRSAFLQSHTIRDKILEYHVSRVSRIIASETPIPLSGSAKIVLHLIPFSSLVEPRFVSIEQLKSQIAGAHPISSSGYDYQINFDGIVNYFGAKNDEKQASYVQLERSGIIEAVDAFLLRGDDEKKGIPSQALEERLIVATKSYITTLRKLDFSPPFALAMSILNVHSYKMFVQRDLEWGPTAKNRIEKNELRFPLLSIDDFNCDVDALLKPIFDALWNAAGFEKSYNYNNEGRWSPRR